MATTRLSLTATPGKPYSFSPKGAAAITRSAFETITINESQLIESTGSQSFNVYETITIGEDFQVVVVYDRQAYESISVSEEQDVAQSYVVTAFDTVSISEDYDRVATFNRSESESISVLEEDFLFTSNIAAYEVITISESKTVVKTVSGLESATIVGRPRSISLAGTPRSISLRGGQR